MPDDLGDIEEVILRRIDEVRSHKLLMLLSGTKCNCVHCRKRDSQNNIPKVSLF